ncbi:MAG: phosphate ABC transporter permease PtsA [Leifsonia xyli]|nr:MAG: phosphate ABC transporter permease PtsA [Leifsonia xyli]
MTTATPASRRRVHRRVHTPAQPAARTHLPTRDHGAQQPDPNVRRDLSRVHRVDILRLVGAGAAGIAGAFWLCTQLLAVTHPLGFVLIAYALFLGCFVLLISFDDNRVTIKDRVAGVIVHSSAVVVLLALGVVVVSTLLRGSDAFLKWNFWVQDLSLAGPQQPLTEGGMLHAAVGTLIMISIALAIAIPLGLVTAVMMAEFPSPFTNIVRTVCEAMTALPSIVCGLFIYATYILIFGFDKSGFAAALAVTIMILPIIIRSADVVLRLVPATLKEASYATGASHWRTIWHVVLPTSKSGLMTAIVLGTARGIGETSPVLLTAGYTTFLEFNPFSGPMVSLPFATFTLVKSPEPVQIARGFGAAAVLMLLVFILFLVARIIGGKGAGILSPAALARSRARSARAARRFDERQLTHRVVATDDGDTEVLRAVRNGPEGAQP